MRGVRRVADQHHVFVMPLLAQNALKFQPDRRTTQMLGIRKKWVAVEPVGKETLTQRDRLFGAHFVDAGYKPVYLRRFDDERGPLRVEAIGMQREPAPRGFAEIEREGIQLFARAQPDETVLANLHIGTEDVFALAARDR